MRLKLLSGEVSPRFHRISIHHYNRWQVGHWRAPTISNMLGEAHAAGHVQLVVDSDQGT